MSGIGRIAFLSIVAVVVVAACEDAGRTPTGLSQGASSDVMTGAQGAPVPFPQIAESVREVRFDLARESLPAGAG